MPNFIFVFFRVSNILDGLCYVKLLESKNVICLSQQHFAWLQSIAKPCIFSTANMQMLNISMVKHQSFVKTIVSLVSVALLQCGEHHLILKGGLKRTIFSSKYKKKISNSYDYSEELETDLKYFQRYRDIQNPKLVLLGRRSRRVNEKKRKLMIIKPNFSKAEASSLCCFFCICSHHRFMKNWKKNQENSGRENIAKKQASLGRFQLAVGMWNSCRCPLIR